MHTLAYFQTYKSQHDTFPLTCFEKTISELGFLSHFGYPLSFRLYLIQFQALPNPHGRSIYFIAALYKTWYALASRIMFPKGVLILPTMSLMRNSKGIGSRADLFSANLFPTDVSRRVHTFEVPGPELKRVLVVPSQKSSHQIRVQSKSYEGHE